MLATNLFCTESDAEATTGQLDFGEMAGIFLIFAGFIALAFLALIMECCYAAYTDRVRDKQKVGGFNTPHV